MFLTIAQIFGAVQIGIASTVIVQILMQPERPLYAVWQAFERIAQNRIGWYFAKPFICHLCMAGQAALWYFYFVHGWTDPVGWALFITIAIYAAQISGRWVEK